MRLAIRVALTGALCVSLAAGLHAEPACASSIGELRAIVADPSFATVWRETTMQDGKPMTVSLHDTRDGLLLRFTKTRAGLWAESAGQICQRAGGLRIDVSSAQLRLGPAANWVARVALASGASFTLTQLAADRLRIAARGWSGDFVPEVQ